MLGVAVQKTEKKKQINKNKVVFCLLNFFSVTFPLLFLSLVKTSALVTFNRVFLAKSCFYLILIR